MEKGILESLRDFQTYGGDGEREDFGMGRAPTGPHF